MRAGPYAVVDGVTYSCGPRHAPEILLLVPKDEPPPRGFERSKGYWERLVARSSVSRLSYVETIATWRKVAVEVLAVSGDRAHVEYRGAGFNGRPELTLTDYAVWSGWVPVSSLTDVVEDELEYQE